MISKAKRFKLSLPARATVFYTLTGAIERGVGFIFTPIYTRILSPEEFGLYPLYVSWMGIATVIITLELSGNTVYRGLARAKGLESEYVSATMGLLLTSAGVSCGLILAFRGEISALTGLSAPLLAILLLQIVTNGITALYFAKCRYEYKYKTASIINLANALLTPSLALIIIRLTPLRSEGRIIAPLVVGLAVSIPIAINTFAEGRCFFARDIWKKHLFTVIPLLPHFLASSITVQSGKLAIGRFFGEDALARYSLIFSFGFIFTVVTVGINSGFTPWINRKLSHGGEEKVGRLTEELFYFFSILAVMAIAFVPEGLSILAPREYLDALPAIYPLTISVIISFLSNVLYSVTVFYEKGHLVTLGSVITATVTVLLHLFLTRRFGYIGAALVATVGGGLNLLFYAVILGGVLKKRFFRFKKLFTPLFFAASFSTLLYFFRSSILSRLALFLALFVLLVPRAVISYRLVKENNEQIGVE